MFTIFMSVKVGNTPGNTVVTCPHELSSSFESEVFCPESTIKKFALPTTISVYIQNHRF